MIGPEAVIGLCLALEVHANRPVFIPTSSFTLAWTHSIERQRWEEDYALQEPLSTESQTSPSQDMSLKPIKARIKGSGAGMEPGLNARLVNGWYEYAPPQVPLNTLRLSRSFFTEDFSICINQTCRNMSEVLPSDGGVTLLWGCKKTLP